MSTESLLAHVLAEADNRPSRTAVEVCDEIRDLATDMAVEVTSYKLPDRKLLRAKLREILVIGTRLDRDFGE